MWIISVLARPGTPTSRQWPRAKIAISSSSSTASWPTITLPISDLSRPKASFSRSTAARSSSLGRGSTGLVSLTGSLRGLGVSDRAGPAGIVCRGRRGPARGLLTIDSERVGRCDLVGRDEDGPDHRHDSSMPHHPDAPSRPPNRWFHNNRGFVCSISGPGARIGFVSSWRSRPTGPRGCSTSPARPLRFS